jgi:ankyrin
LITRLRQEAQFIDEQGGLLTSSIIPTVQAHIPEKALQKRIRVSLHVLPISTQLLQRAYGTRVNVSPVVTVEPRRRKFHKPITITIPLPSKVTKQGHQKDSQQHGNAYTSDSQTLRLLCSITGGTHAAQFDDITGHTPLTFSNDCATFTTTVSARFWLIDAHGVSDVLKLAHEIYRESTQVPYMSRFIVFAKRNDPNEALARVFCITDDKENKTLEMQEHFIEIAKSKEVEVVNGNTIYLDLQSNNLQTITKTNEQLTFTFRAFRENRLPCVVRVRDQQQEPTGRLIFSKDNGKLTSLQRTASISMTNGHGPSNINVDPQSLQAICNLNIVIPPYDKVRKRFDFCLILNFVFLIGYN